MPKSYSEDLRWRAVWLHIAQGMSYQDISRLLFMSERSVQRYMERFHATGTVAPTLQKRGPDKILTEFQQFSSGVARVWQSVALATPIFIRL